MTNLTNDALSKAKEALTKIEQARLVVNALCDGSLKWSLSVPARPEADPDLVIAGALKAAQEALSALSALSQEARPVAYATVTAIDCLKNEGRGFVWRDKDGESDIPLYAHPQPAQQDAYTEEQLFAAARGLSDHNAEICNVNKDDNWMIYSASFVEDARTVLDAALAQKGGSNV